MFELILRKLVLFTRQGHCQTVPIILVAVVGTIKQESIVLPKGIDLLLIFNRFEVMRQRKKNGIFLIKI
jgi:hypothetical protein